MRESTEIRRQRFLCALLIIILAVFSGCEAPPLTQPQYIEKSFLDLSSLQGNRIVIDPGHGGQFSGAIGKRGLREADVNLAVGLHLWGLLNQAGAEVWLTRSADVDLISERDGGLKEDLDARAKLSNEVNADLFISIHHNSNTRDRKKNNLQIYYRLIDPGPSHDLARCVARELGKGLPPEQVFILPGNFRVLRETQATAILGEASFLSHEKNEKRLSVSNQLRREAEDYFAGILAYLDKGIPETVTLNPNEVTLDAALSPIEARLLSGQGARAIDPASAAIFLDGRPVSHTYYPQEKKLVHTPQVPLENGWHTFYVAARNFNGNALRTKHGRFCIALPPKQLIVSSSFSRLPADENISSRIDVTAVDRYGNPVADGTEIILKASGGELDRQVLLTTGGVGFAYFSPPPQAGEVDLVASSNGVRANTRVRCGPISQALLRVKITNQDHIPVSGVEIIENDCVLGTTDQTGLAFFTAGYSNDTTVTLSKAGYLARQETLYFREGEFRDQLFALVSRAGGLFLGRTFTLDPEPWDKIFAEENGLKPQSEGANIRVALYLQALLEEAGANVILTRDSLDVAPSLGDRLRAGEMSKSELYLTVTHRSRNPSVGYYFSSATGKHLAQQLARSIQKECGLNEIPVEESSGFTIIHPSCPSVVVNFGPASETPRDETLKQEARGVYEGLAAFLGASREW